MDAALAPFDRPDRTLIVSGISRSGTSLFSVLLNHLDDVVCFNEVLPLEPGRLPEALARVRRDLLAGKPVRNKFDAKGRLTTDTLDGMVKKKSRVDKALSEEVCVASKRNIPYLNHAEALLGLGYRMVAMVRDPVYTLGSWGSPKAVSAGIPGARVAPGDVHPHWSGIDFQGRDLFERRAEAWQHCAERIWGLRRRIWVLRYEELCQQPRRVMEHLCGFAGLPALGALPDIVQPPQNVEGRYPDLEQIRPVVEALCPARTLFGYP